MFIHLFIYVQIFPSDALYGIERLSIKSNLISSRNMTGTADQLAHASSTGTSNNLTAKYLGNTVGGVGLTI